MPATTALTAKAFNTFLETHGIIDVDDITDIEVTPAGLRISRLVRTDEGVVIIDPRFVSPLRSVELHPWDPPHGGLVIPDAGMPPPLHGPNGKA